MNMSTTTGPAWLIAWMTEQGVGLWGTADLQGFQTPTDSQGRRFPLAISLALPLDPQIMTSIQNGPNQAYADEYDRLNARLNELAARLVAEITGRGFEARGLAASERTDTINIKGEFPHKTAATCAGLGWIGRHCQLITRKYGSWVRLGTVFTDMPLPCGRPVPRHFCGSCRRCVEACPAQALTGKAWHPGMAREEILAAAVCDRFKKTHYLVYHQGHVCGICSAVCPYGHKALVGREATEQKQGL